MADPDIAQTPDSPRRIDMPSPADDGSTFVAWTRDEGGFLLGGDLATLMVAMRTGAEAATSRDHPTSPSTAAVLRRAAIVIESELSRVQTTVTWEPVPLGERQELANRRADAPYTVAFLPNPRPVGISEPVLVEETTDANDDIDEGEKGEGWEGREPSIEEMTRAELIARLTDLSRQQEKLAHEQAKLSVEFTTRLIADTYVVQRDLLKMTETTPTYRQERRPWEA